MHKCYQTLVFDFRALALLWYVTVIFQSVLLLFSTKLTISSFCLQCVNGAATAITIKLKM